MLTPLESLMRQWHELNPAKHVFGTARLDPETVAVKSLEIDGVPDAEDADKASGRKLAAKDLEDAYGVSFFNEDNEFEITPEMLDRLAHKIELHTDALFPEGQNELTANCQGFRTKEKVETDRPQSETMEELQQMCTKANAYVNSGFRGNENDKYHLSFDIHYNIVKISKWGHANFRLARLVMHKIQEALGLQFFTQVTPSQKREYMNSLIESLSKNDPKAFYDAMTGFTKSQVREQIDDFLYETIKNYHGVTMDRNSKLVIPRKVANQAFSEQPDVKDIINCDIKTSAKILELLKINPFWGAGGLAYLLGLQPKAVEKQFKRLRDAGKIERVGSPKNGHWKVN